MTNNSKNPKVIELAANAKAEITVAELQDYMADLASQEFSRSEETSKPAVRICGLESLKTKKTLVFEKKEANLKSFPSPNT